MAVPKRYKRQIKAAMSGNQTTTIRDVKTKVPTTKRTWSLKVGDLVEDGDDCGIIIDGDGDGHYLILSGGGRKWKKANNLSRVQKAIETTAGVQKKPQR
jgi:hypothetical protein